MQTWVMRRRRGGITVPAVATLSQAAAPNTTAAGCRFNPYDSGGAPIQMDQRSAVRD